MPRWSCVEAQFRVPRPRRSMRIPWRQVAQTGGSKWLRGGVRRGPDPQKQNRYSLEVRYWHRAWGRWHRRTRWRWLDGWHRLAPLRRKALKLWRSVPVEEQGLAQQVQVQMQAPPRAARLVPERMTRTLLPKR